MPTLLALNYATLVEDPDESESLAIPFDMMRHGIKVDLTPPQHGGKCGMLYDEDFLPFQYDEEKLYVNITKPTDDDLDQLEWFELNNPYPFLNKTVRRRKKKVLPGDIPKMAQEIEDAP